MGSSQATTAPARTTLRATSRSLGVLGDARRRGGARRRRARSGRAARSSRLRSPGAPGASVPRPAGATCARCSPTRTVAAAITSRSGMPRCSSFESVRGRSCTGPGVVVGVDVARDRVGREALGERRARHAPGERADAVPDVEEDAALARGEGLGPDLPALVEQAAVVAVEAVRDDVAGPHLREQLGQRHPHVDHVHHQRQRRAHRRPRARGRRAGRGSGPTIW